MKLNKIVVRVAVWLLLGAALLFLQYSDVAKEMPLRSLLIVTLIFIAAAYLFFSVARVSRHQSRIRDVEAVMKAEEEDRH